MNSYNNKLNNFKKSMGGGAEIDLIVDLIRKHLVSTEINWLDVGIGDGEYTRILTNKLENEDLSVEVHGIEPDRQSYEQATSRFGESNLHNTIFSEFESQKRFNVIILNHSVYYLSSLYNSLLKIKELLSEEGLLLITLWTPNDSLYTLKERIWGNPMCPSDLSQRLDDVGLDIVAKERFFGTIDYSSWTVADNLENNLSIISRTEPVTKSDVDAARKMIKNMPDYIQNRENIVLVGK